MNCKGSSEYMTVFTSFTRASFLKKMLLHFIVDFAQKWLREKTFYYPLLHFIVNFARATFVTVGVDS